MSDSEGNLDLHFGSEQSGFRNTNYQSILGNTSIAPNSRYDQSFSFDSDDAMNGGDSDMDVPPRPKSPRNRYDAYDEDSGYAGYNAPTPPRANSPSYDQMGDMGAADDYTALFGLISSFTPNPVDLQVHWKPFLPDLVPAIGSIDAFIKVPRPDGDLDELGLVIVDEPSISQSNPQILKMELREQYGLTSPDNQSDSYIGFIEDPQKNSKALTSWLESLEEIHRQRPPPSVIYSSKMPEMEALMEPWPDKFEDALKSLMIPSSELDLSFDDYARVICAVLEIPVKGNIIESLHHLFSLFAEFEGNQHFQALRQ